MLSYYIFLDNTFYCFIISFTTSLAIINPAVDGTKEINNDFTYSNERIFELIRQVRDRTVPSVTIQYHKLRVNETDILVLEIPFSEQLHRTSKGEFL